MKIRSIMTVMAVGSLFLLFGCASSGKNATARRLYKTAEGEDAARASYDAAMGLWTVPYTEERVRTAFGETHVIVAGPENGKPLFLFPGLFADATMWYPNAGALAEKYRVYALDMINYGGKSEPAGETVSGAGDYARWFTDILAHYGYRKAAVAGLSYGSWLALALAREIPESIAAAVLLDPSETFVRMDGGIAWRGLWTFAVFPSRAKYASFFDWIGGGYSDPSLEIWFEHMLDVIEFGAVGMTDIPRHRVYAPEELGMVTMPTLVLAGGKPILYKDPDAFAVAAKRALPAADIEIVPDAGHGLNMEKPDRVNERMLEFLQERYL